MEPTYNAQERKILLSLAMGAPSIPTVCYDDTGFQFLQLNMASRVDTFRMQVSIPDKVSTRTCAYRRGRRPAASIKRKEKKRSGRHAGGKGEQEEGLINRSILFTRQRAFHSAVKI